MSLSTTAWLSRIFSNSHSPKPTEDDLNGYPHIIRANPHIVEILPKEVNNSVTPLKKALESLNTPKAIDLVSRFEPDRLQCREDTLFVTCPHPGTYALRKDTLQELRDFCLSNLPVDAPDNIKQPFHNFLIRFPAITLHEDFVRPRDNLSKQGHPVFTRTARNPL